MKQNMYKVIYENEAGITIEAQSLTEAIENATKALLGCMPKSFNPENLVKPVSAMQMGFCALCGAKSTKTICELCKGDL